MSILSERARLIEKLQEQFDFLRRSCEAFDSGAENEAIRIATTLRVLFHDTPNNSVSVMTHLGMQDEEMLSSARGHGDYKDYLQYRIDFTSSEPMKAKPMLGDNFTKMPLKTWWEIETVFQHAGQDYSRSKIVRAAANKDGGAHVDKKLDKYYEVLSCGEFAFGITGNLTFNGPAPFRQGVTYYATNAHLALIRQFAHETLTSAHFFGWPIS